MFRKPKTSESEHLDKLERFHEVQQQWDKSMREHQSKADAYCVAQGLHTVDQMRAWIKSRIGKIGHLREPGEEG